MKTQSLYFLLLFFFITISGSLFAQDPTEQIEGAAIVSISCEGACECSLEGVLESNVQCTCNECTMRVTISESGSQAESTTYDLSDASMEVPMVDEFMEFESKSGETFVLLEIELYRNGEDVAVLFTYKDEVGNTHTIMFARAGDKTYKINCEGECGCREVYSFETNSASCSCTECTMTVEEVSSQ